jgi:hypothetical protein
MLECREEQKQEEKLSQDIEGSQPTSEELIEQADQVFAKPKNWKLRYTQPFRQAADNSIQEEEMIEDLGTTNPREARVKADEFLSRGAIIIGGENHPRKEVGLFAGDPPPGMEQIRRAFFDHKKDHPDPVPYEDLSPLQKRMQSGFEFPGYGKPMVPSED